MTFWGLGIWDLGIIGLGFVRGEPLLEHSSNGLRNRRSVISARAEHGRSGDPGLWVRNKEQWTDRRVMTAHTRVRWLRPVSRSSGIKEGAIS